MQVLALLLAASVAWAAENHLQVRHESKAAPGVPVAADFEAPAGFNPDSVRVMAEGSSKLIPSKTEWRVPKARVSFRSTGAAAYRITFD